MLGGRGSIGPSFHGGAALLELLGAPGRTCSVITYLILDEWGGEIEQDGSRGGIVQAKTTR